METHKIGTHTRREPLREVELRAIGYMKCIEKMLETSTARENAHKNFCGDELKKKNLTIHI